MTKLREERTHVRSEQSGGAGNRTRGQNLHEGLGNAPDHAPVGVIESPRQRASGNVVPIDARGPPRDSTTRAARLRIGLGQGLPCVPTRGVLDSATDERIFLAMAASARVQQILSLAAELSREERQQVAAELLSALEPGDAIEGPEWDEAWRVELARRAADGSPGVPLARVRELVNEALSTARRERASR